MNSFYWYILGGLGYVAALLGVIVCDNAAGSLSQAAQTGSWLIWGGLVVGSLAVAAGYLWSRYTTDGMVPSDGAVDWLFDAYGWLLEEFGEADELDATYLVTPTPYDIPLEAAGKDRIAEVFDAVRGHAGMDEWPCRLRFHETYFSGQETARRLGVQHESPAPRGTYRVDYEGEQAIISCDPTLASRPNELVAVLAHELAHYLLDTASEPPPGGEEFLEEATDLASIFLGFGIFAANAATSFEHHGDGVKEWSRSGYLSESEFAYGLAIFTALHDIETAGVAEFLDTNPRAYFEKARLDIERHRAEELERLRELAENP